VINLCHVGSNNRDTITDDRSAFTRRRKLSSPSLDAGEIAGDQLMRRTDPGRHRARQMDQEAIQSLEIRARAEGDVLAHAQATQYTGLQT
jgi:hypothetical protein